MIEKNKDSQTQSLAELQQELKSLKALLLSRGSGLSPSPSSPLPFPGRPSIPAWQLAGTSNPMGLMAMFLRQSLLPSPATTAPSTNGKEKETRRLKTAVVHNSVLITAKLFNLI
jgi:peroxin-14